MQLTLRRDKGFTEQERFLAGQLRAHLVSAFGKNCATPTAQPNRKTGPAELRGLGLTPRECEVLHWVIQGKSDVKIAKTIGTATRTVDKHMENILRKLGAETRLAAVRLATDRLARD